MISLALKNQTVIVTGASGNIGAGIALSVAEAGAQVVVHFASDYDGAKRTVKAIEAVGGSAAAIEADLTAENGPSRLIINALDAFGTIDGLVNNAGIQPVEPLIDVTPYSHLRMLDVNAVAPTATLQACARYWISKKRPGAVVNVASIEGVQPAPGHAHYAASKAALLMLTKAAALEFGSHGIRVNAISPGLIFRDGIETTWPEGVERWQSCVPLRRMGEPKDLGDAVDFLLSDSASFITGVNLPIDGGMLARPMW